MQIPVLIEPTNNHGYRATIGPPVAMTAEGATREEALQHLREVLQRRLSAGAEIAPFELGATEHPLAPFSGAGMLKDDPLFEAWQQAIEEYRRQKDEEPEGP
jgi:hypothetical protein